MTLRRAVALLAMVTGAGMAQEAPTRQNWFNDPFFQISNSIPGCPLPAGPFMTEAEQRASAHARAEKGTTCWLTGACDRPNAYAYDQDIAAALRRAVAQRGPFTGSTLWVTVQGRAVFFEGCASNKALASELEALARTVPDVVYAVASVRTDPKSVAPYKLRSQR